MGILPMILEIILTGETPVPRLRQVFIQTLNIFRLVLPFTFTETKH